MAAPGKSISGTNTLLYIKRENDAGFLMAACQVTTSMDTSRDSTTEETKCATEITTGSLTGTFSIDGEARYDIDPGDDAISFAELMELNLSGERFTAVIKDSADPANIYLQNDVFISSLTLTAENKSSVKFSAEFTMFDAEQLITEPTT